MSQSDPSPPDPSTEAEEAFTEFLALRGSPDEESFEEFCAERPELAPHLRELRGDLDRLDRVLSRLGIAGDVTWRLRSEFGDAVDPRVSLDPSSEDSSDEQVERLARLPRACVRYSTLEEVARGGMGGIFRVWDRDLRRNLAMKVLLGTREMLSPEEKVPVDPRKLSRFLEEAQITGQLDHPGIVPVHDLGLDSRGRAFFTMRLVRGENLQAIIRHVKEGREAWTQTRALNVILRVCEAVAFAHSKGVIHRDLKPANIMVGRFGETYVMDWGLAKVMSREDSHEARLRMLSEEQSLSLVETDRAREEGYSPDSPIWTMDGEVVGTPVYMSPEQARGHVEEVGPRSDVYAVGAMLYQLLTFQRPYVREGERVSVHTILNAVRTGPPIPVLELAADVPAEAAAICEKAMARDPEDRYGDMIEMADDLRAFLEGRVVHAYETGARAELRKWVARNKGLAASIGFLVLLIVGSLSRISYVQAAGKRAAMLERDRADLLARQAETSADSARTNETMAREALAKVLQFSDGLLVQELIREEKDLWPVLPEKTAELREWLTRAAELTDRRDRYRTDLEEVRGLALEYSSADSAADHAAQDARYGPRLADEIKNLKWLESALQHPARSETTEWHRDRTLVEVERLERAMEERLTWRFEGQEDRWRHAVLSALVADLGALEEGSVHVRERLDLSRTLDDRSIHGDAARRLWKAVCSHTASDPMYGGLDLVPQLGLLPLRRDPDSGLWEFAHLASGKPPVVDPITDHYEITSETGFVLVLVPGGTFRMGSDPPSADRPVGSPNVDEDHVENEGPIREVRLRAFFLSKYEVTQEQWAKVMGDYPSATVDWNYAEAGTWPVESVSWDRCQEAVRRWDLLLPTEAQWEYACRAGTTSPFASGVEPTSLQGSANVCDRTARLGLAYSDWKYTDEIEDGFEKVSPVGSFAGNPFGFHDMHGNVFEWARDAWALYSQFTYQPGDAFHDVIDTGFGRVVRGGSWAHPAYDARSAVRTAFRASESRHFLGLRPSRAVRD